MFASDFLVKQEGNQCVKYSSSHMNIGDGKVDLILSRSRQTVPVCITNESTGKRMQLFYKEKPQAFVLWLRPTFCTGMVETATVLSTICTVSRQHCLLYYAFAYTSVLLEYYKLYS